MAEKSSRSRRARREEVQARKQRQRIVAAVIGVVTIVALGALFYFAQRADEVAIEDVNLPESLTLPANADGAAWGPVAAPVLIEEFGDYQ